MAAQNSSPNEYYPGEQLLFTIRRSMKKRLITAAIFAFFILVSLAGILVLKSYT